MKFDPMQTMRDLSAAREAAVEAAKDVKDEGTCNFDHCRLRFPRLRSETVEAVGGLRRVFGGVTGTYQVENPIPAQAHQRTVQADTICKMMKERGYDAYVFYMMD